MRKNYCEKVLLICVVGVALGTGAWMSVAQESATSRAARDQQILSTWNRVFKPENSMSGRIFFAHPVPDGADGCASERLTMRIEEGILMFALDNAAPSTSINAGLQGARIVIGSGTCKIEISARRSD